MMQTGTDILRTSMIVDICLLYLTVSIHDEGRSGVNRPGAAGGPDRLAVVQLDPLAPAELLGQIDFRGLDAQPLGVGDGCDPAPGQHGGPRPVLTRRLRLR